MCDASDNKPRADQSEAADRFWRADMVGAIRVWMDANDIDVLVLSGDDDTLRISAISAWSVAEGLTAEQAGCFLACELMPAQTLAAFGETTREINDVLDTAAIRAGACKVELPSTRGGSLVHEVMLALGFAN